MEIRAVDTVDEVQVRRYHEIFRRAEEEDGRPWNAWWTYDEVAGMLREPTGDQRMEGWVAADGEQMVGAALLMFSLLDNTDKGFLYVAVEPELRRRGIGGELVEAMVDRVRDEGRTKITSDATYAFERRHDAPTLRFARKHGFTQANMEIYRVLRLPVAPALLEEIAAESAPHHVDYRVQTFVDAMPERYLASYCHLQNQLVLDAPMGDLDYEVEALTPEVVLEKQARNRRIGRTLLYTLAIDGDDEAVAHSDLMLPPEGHQARQFGTLVRRDHRGHRLGLAVKVANLVRVQRDRPDITEVHTENAEVNAQMVGINDRLGFEAVAVCPAFKRVLRTSRKTG